MTKLETQLFIYFIFSAKFPSGGITRNVLHAPQNKNTNRMFPTRVLQLLTYICVIKYKNTLKMASGIKKTSTRLKNAGLLYRDNQKIFQTCFSIVIDS